MLTIHNGSMFAACKLRAMADDSVNELMDRLSYLANFGDVDEEMLCNLYPREDGDFDFALSRNVGTQDDPIWQRFMSGGLVYHKYNNSWGVHT